MNFIDFFAVVGLAVIASVTLRWIYALLTNTRRLEEFKYGWAAVTGATDGIGLAYANELAHRGFKLILISRNPSKLQTVQSQLQAKFSTQVETIAADFSDSHKNTEELIELLKERLSCFEVSVLINNVGTAILKPFKETLWEEIETLIAINIYPQVLITHTVLPQMVERFKTKLQKSLILNVSAANAHAAIESYAVYAATKRFNLNFSKSLYYELENQGVIVSAVCPGYTDTPLFRSLGLTRYNPVLISPEAFVKSSLNQFWKVEAVGHWRHCLLLVMKLIPFEWRTQLINLNYKSKVFFTLNS